MGSYDYLGSTLGYMSGLYTRELDWCPAAQYPAKDWTNAWNAYTYNASQPYGFYYSYPGNRSYYYVEDSFSLPYEVAMRMKGYNTSAAGMARVASNCVAICQQGGKSYMASVACESLNAAQSVGEWKDSEALSERSDLKEEARTIEEKSKALLKKLDEVMKNEENLSNEQVLAKVKAIRDQGATLKTQAEELFKKCKEVEEEYNAKKQEEAAQEVADVGGGDGGSGNGTSSVTTEEGDTSLTTRDQLSAQYNVRKPVVEADADVSSVVCDVKAHTSNDDDKKDHDEMMKMFATKKLNECNIIEVMDSLLSEGHDLYDGIYEMNNSKDIMKEFIRLMKDRVNLLKGEDYLYLTSAEAKEVLDIIRALEAKIIVSGDDIPSSSPRITIGNEQKNFNEACKIIIEKLKITIGNESVLRGSQKHFDKKIEEKKTERKEKALKAFYGDHAKTKAGKTVKDEKAALPDGLSYLPNSKKFQYKYDSEHIFKADSYSKLNDAILNSKDTKIIAAWNEVLKKLDENLK